MGLELVYKIACVCGNTETLQGAILQTNPPQ